MSEEKKNETLYDAVRSGDVGDVRRLLDDGARVDQRVDDWWKRTSLLHVAAERGHVSVMELLLEKGGDVDTRNNRGSTPLHIAAEQGYTEVIACIVERGGDVNAKDDFGYTPLHHAASNGEKAAVRCLLDQKCNVDTRNCWGQTPLHRAAMWGDTEVIACIVERGGDVNSTDEGGNTPLYNAAYNGNKAAVRCLLDQKCNVDTRNCNGNTPLHDAARFGHTEVIACIVERGGDVNAKDNYGYTPLHHAASNGEKAAVRCLLAKKCNVDTRNSGGSTPLHDAAEQGHTEVIACIVERGGDVNSTDEDGNTPLHIAAYNGKKAAVQCLLDQKCNVDTRNSWGSTPLHKAARQGYTEVIACIAERGGDVNSTNEDGDTPLHLAVMKHRTVVATLLQRCGAEVTLHHRITLVDAILLGCVQLFNLLVVTGADVNAKTGRLKDTLLRCAVRHDSLDIMEELIGRGCDVNAADRKGNTPLHVAAQHGRHGLMKTLVEAGGNVNTQGERDRTPLHVAVCKKKRTCVSALLGLNADTECVDRDGNTAGGLSQTKAITKLLSDQSTRGCNPSIPTNEQPLVNRKRRHDESIAPQSSKTPQLFHPTVSNDQSTTEQLLHIPTGTVEEDVFNPRAGDCNSLPFHDQMPCNSSGSTNRALLLSEDDTEAAQTSADISNFYTNRHSIVSITPVDMNTSSVTSPSRPWMAPLNNTSEDERPSVVCNENRRTTSYDPAEAAHQPHIPQSSACSWQSMPGNTTYVINDSINPSSLGKLEDTVDSSYPGSTAHSFGTTKPFTLTAPTQVTPEKGHVTSSIHLQDDDNNNGWDPFERPNVSGQPNGNVDSRDLQQAPRTQEQSTYIDDVGLIPNHILTASSSVPERPPPQSAVDIHAQGTTASMDISQLSMELTQLQAQCRHQADEIRRLQDEVVSHKAAKQTPSNQSQAQIRQQAEEIRRLQDEVVSIKAATKPTSNQCQSEVGQPPDTNQSLQPASGPPPAVIDEPSYYVKLAEENERLKEHIRLLKESSQSKPPPETSVVPPLYERPSNPNHYQPTHGQRIPQCLYKILPAGQRAPQGYEQLAEGSAHNVVVPSDWMEDFRKVCMSKPPSYQLTKMVDGLYEPKELYKKKASSDLYSTDLGKALRSYAIDVLKMASSQVTDVLNSKITTVTRRCRQQQELLQ